MSNQTVGVSGLTSRNKIPEYARWYAREYQLIRGINNEFGYLKSKLDNLNNGLFESQIAERIKYLLKCILEHEKKVN